MSSAYDVLLDSLGPRGHWPLNDAVGSVVAADLSGNGHAANLQAGSPTFGVPGPVLFQNALTNNNSEWLTNFKPDSTWTGLTAIAWVKGPWFGTGGNPRIIAAGHTDGDGTGFQLGFFGNLEFDVGARGFMSIGSSGSWDSTVWHMIGGAFDGASGAAAMYFDGAQAATAAWSTGNLVTPSPNLGFGYNSAYNGDQWSGDLAEVSVFDKALTAPQFASLFAAAQRVYPGWIGEAGWLS